MKDHSFFDCDDASIWLPKDCKLLRPLPRLVAEFKEGIVTVDLSVEDFVWNVFMDNMGEPLPINPLCELVVVRRGIMKSPYKGCESIVQTRVFATNYFQYRWDLLLEDGHHKVIISIGGPGKFAEAEEKWIRVLDTFRFK